MKYKQGLIFIGRKDQKMIFHHPAKDDAGIGDLKYPVAEFRINDGKKTGLHHEFPGFKRLGFKNILLKI